MAGYIQKIGSDFGKYAFGNLGRTARNANKESSRLNDSKSGNQPRVWLTGPDLIDRIVRAVEHGQSVLLSGPRGCGKSYCCRQVIREAERRGIVTLGASKTFQGNREVPRSDIFDDDIEFQVREIENEVKTFIEKRSAPVFAFADRDEKNRIVIDPHTGRVPCYIEKKTDQNGVFEVYRRPVRRFVLFLDEVNRFADGILDAMLTILEEKFALMGGNRYPLPITVLMTMNPPGYDATARVLSPPLAARISRSYRLFSPDMDTLTDLIIASKMDDLEESIKNEYEEAINSVIPDKTSDKVARFTRTPELIVNPKIRRKVALITLLLWGNPDWRPGESADNGKEGAGMRAGMEYLTGESLDLIRGSVKAVPKLKPHLDTLCELCRFGPDGRAASDWLTSAAAHAREKLPPDELQPKIFVTEEDLIATCVESLSHKIYDDFSPASEPNKVARKEESVLAVCTTVLTSAQIDGLQGLARPIDDRNFGDRFKGLVEVPDNSKSSRTKKVYEAFAKARVTSKTDTESWLSATVKMRDSIRGATGGYSQLAKDLAKQLEHEKVKEEVLVEPDDEDLPPVRKTVSTPMFVTESSGVQSCFTNRKWLRLCSEIGKLNGKLPRVMRELVQQSNYRVSASPAVFVEKSRAARLFDSKAPSGHKLQDISLEYLEIVVKVLDRLADLTADSNRSDPFIEIARSQADAMSEREKKQLFEVLGNVCSAAKEKELFGLTADLVDAIKQGFQADGQ